MGSHAVSLCCTPQGLDVTSLREIKVLRELKSPYVVNVLDIVPHKKKFTMVRPGCRRSDVAVVASLPPSCYLVWYPRRHMAATWQQWLAVRLHPFIHPLSCP